MEIYIYHILTQLHIYGNLYSELSDTIIRFHMHPLSMKLYREEQIEKRKCHE